MPTRSALGQAAGPKVPFIVEQPVFKNFSPGFKPSAEYSRHMLRVACSSQLAFTSMLGSGAASGGGGGEFR